MNWRLFNIVNLLVLICFWILAIYWAWLYSIINSWNNFLIEAKDWFQLSLASLWLLLTALWFYFWYKKYEWDKEFETINNFSKEYLEYRNDVLIASDEDIDFYIILSLWYKYYTYYERWYIKKGYWDEIINWIRLDLNYFIESTLKEIEYETYFYTNNFLDALNIFIIQVWWNNFDVLFQSKTYWKFLKNEIMSYIDEKIRIEKMMLEYRKKKKSDKEKNNEKAYLNQIEQDLKRYKNIKKLFERKYRIY